MSSESDSLDYTELAWNLRMEVDISDHEELLTVIDSYEDHPKIQAELLTAIREIQSYGKTPRDWQILASGRTLKGEATICVAATVLGY